MNRIRIPFIEQGEQSECGLCCLAMIISYYKCNYEIYELREEYSIGRDGTNLLILKKMAEQKGFKCKGFRINTIEDIMFPAILNVNNEHFIVAEKRFKNFIVILDPQRGRYRLSEEDIKERNIYIGLKITKTADVKERKRKRIFGAYKGLLKNSTPIFISVFLLTIILQILALVSPISANYFVDRYISKGIFIDLKILLLFVMLLMIIHFSLGSIKAIFTVALQRLFNENLSKKFVEKILYLPHSFFKKRGAGDIVHRYSGTVIVREMLSSRIIEIWLDIGLVFVYNIYIFWLSPLFAVLMDMLAIVIIIISIFNVIKGQEYIAKEVMEEARTSSFFNELVHAMKIVKIKGSEAEVFDKWNIYFRKQMIAMSKKGKFVSIMTASLSTIQFITPLLLLILAFYFVGKGELSIGMVFSIYIVAQSFYGPIVSGISTINEILYANTYFRRIYEVLKTEEEKNLKNGIDCTSLTGKIEVKNVGFKYSINGKSILKDISFNVAPGEFVAIVGETASGKSTLASLLIGLEEIEEGEIWYDHYNISTVNKRSLRKQIGVVSQNNYFFKESIEQNLLLGQENVRREELDRVCKIAEIYDEIQEMPMKYATILSENAKNISGGQKQRIALARALINEPRIVILDEATSALDNITEKRIQDNLSELSCTKIIIAHRLETIENADKILVLNEGKLVGVGTHTELLSRSEYYRALYMRRKNIE